MLDRLNRIQVGPALGLIAILYLPLHLWYFGIPPKDIQDIVTVEIEPTRWLSREEARFEVLNRSLSDDRRRFRAVVVGDTLITRVVLNIQFDNASIGRDTQWVAARRNSRILVSSAIPLKDIIVEPLD